MVNPVALELVELSLILRVKRREKRSLADTVWRDDKELKLGEFPCC